MVALLGEDSCPGFSIWMSIFWIHPEWPGQHRLICRRWLIQILIVWLLAWWNKAAGYGEQIFKFWIHFNMMVACGHWPLVNQNSTDSFHAANYEQQSEAFYKSTNWRSHNQHGKIRQVILKLCKSINSKCRWHNMCIWNLYICHILME